MTTPTDGEQDTTPPDAATTPGGRVTLDDLIEDARRAPATSVADAEAKGAKPGLLPGSETASPTTVSAPSVSSPTAHPTSPPAPSPASPQTATQTTTQTAVQVEPVRRTGPSVPTVVWGVLLALVAAAVIAHQVSTVDLDLGLSGPLVLLGAGGALVVWGIAGIGRARRR